MNEIKVFKNTLNDNMNAIAAKTNQKIIAVVKANAYGLGALGICNILTSNENVDLFAVASVDEALELNDFPQKKLIFGTCNEVEIAQKNNFHLTIASSEWLKKNYSYLKDKQIPLHVKINFGMNRNGISPEEVLNLNFTELNIVGIYSHLYFPENTGLTDSIINNFEKVVKQTKHNYQYIHLLNSAGVLDYECGICTHVRPGILQYGLSPYYSIQTLTKQCFKVVSKIDIIRVLNKGESCGYDNNFTAVEKCHVALVPFGYADGLLKEFNHSHVLINNKQHEIVAITMDYCFVLIDEGVKTTDKVYLFTDVEKNAMHAKTATQEILVNLDKKRTKRGY